MAIDPGIAEVWSNLGMALYRQDKYRESVAAFERAVALKPSLLAPHVFAGLSYRKMGQAAKAIVPLKAALAIDPDQQEAMLALGEVYAQTHQYEAAVRLLQNALKRDPDSESLGSNLAVTYFDWAKDVGNALRHTPNLYGRLLTDTIHAATNSVVAEEDFRATVTFAPDSVEARIALAKFLMQNRPNGAKLRMIEEQIEAAKKISPSDLDVEAAEVSLAIAQDDSAKAVGLLQALIQQDPVFALANLEILTAGLPADAAQQMKEQAGSMAAKSNGSPNSYSSRFAALGRIKSKRLLTAAEDGEYASAAWHLHRYEDGLSEKVNRHSTSPESQYWFFHTCKELGREMLVRTVARHPDSVPTHLLLADFAIQKEDYKTAKAECKMAVDLRPQDPKIRLLSIRVLEGASENEEALREAIQDATEFPFDAGLNFEAGELVLRSKGDAETAVAYLERAVQADPRLNRAKTDLADAYADLRRFDDAIGEIRQILDSDDDGALHYRLARWYRQTGRTAEAAHALEISKKIKEHNFEKETFTSIEQTAKPRHDASY